MSALATYSRIGSRGLPWTSVDPADRVAFRQGRQPGAGRPTDRVAGPFRRGPGLGIEPVDLGTAERRRVVVAADADRADLDEPGDDAVGIGTVADDVAEMPDGIDRAGVREDRIERHEIAVDVRQDRDAHRGRA